MAANVHSVKCPELVCAGCGGEAVQASYLETTVSVAPCSSLLAQGWQGEQLVLWHSQALQYLQPAESARPMVHAAGLVVFA